MTAAVVPAPGVELSSVHAHLRDAAAFISDLDDDSESSLSDRLYRWYLCLEPLPAVPGRLQAADLTPATAFRAAHAGSGRFEGGWTVTAPLGAGGIVAESPEGVERHFRPGEYRTIRTGASRVGDRVLGEIAWSWVEPDTGFWLTRRGEWTPAGSDRLARLYVNVTPRQACEVINGFTDLLMRRKLSFMMKTPASIHGGRADSLVLYLGGRDWPGVRDELVRIAAARSGEQRSATPRFAARLGPGIAWGHGRLDGESFGKLRCDAIAAQVARHRPTSSAGALACVVAALTTIGVDPQQPHCETVGCD